MSRFCMAVAVFAALVVVGPAQAMFIETEPNNVIATADPVSATGPMPWADVGVVSLAAGGGDVDFFSVTLAQDAILTAVTTPIASLFSGPGMLLGVFDSGGTPLVVDDSSGSSNGATVQWLATTPGTYYLGVTGTGDASFLGAHAQQGTYILTLSVVPEPASLLALLAGLPLLLRRRR